MTEERLDQAMDELAPRVARATDQQSYIDGLADGVEWADAHPQPRTVTADQCNDIEDAVHEGVPLGHMLRRLGIEVVDG